MDLPAISAFSPGYYEASDGGEGEWEVIRETRK